MAYGRKRFSRKKPTFKRRPFKRRSYRKRRARSSFTKAPMPNKFATKLRYCGGFTLDPPTGGLNSTHVINAMGCYDPDITGTGHQPRGFDEIMTMYNHYTVVGSKITVDFIQNQGVAYGVGTVGIALKDGNVTYSDINDYMEGRNVVSAVMPASDVTVANTRRLSKTMSTKRFMGVKNVMDNQNLRGNDLANPGDSCFFHCFYGPQPGFASDFQPIYCQFRIEFMVIFTEPKQPDQS